jgi:hypothetical protein
VDLNTLSQRLEHVSQEKEFVSNLSKVQDDMVLGTMWQFSEMDHFWEPRTQQSTGRRQKQQILANDVASFKAASETPAHQDVMKRVCKHLSDIAGHAIVMDYDPENFKDMWIRGRPKNKQEMLIKKWKSSLYQAYLAFYGVNRVPLR